MAIPRSLSSHQRVGLRSGVPRRNLRRLTAGRVWLSSTRVGLRAPPQMRVPVHKICVIRLTFWRSARVGCVCRKRCDDLQ